MLTRGRVQIVERDGVRWKRCECGALFLPERNSRGQETSRRLCSACREVRQRRFAGDLDGARGRPRCRECGAVVGLDLGTVAGLNAVGECWWCEEWRRRRAARQVLEKVPLPAIPGRLTPFEQSAWANYCLGDAAALLGLSVADIRGPGRRPELVSARAGIAHVLRYGWGWTVGRIGVLLGGRDTSTICNLLDRNSRRYPKGAGREWHARAEDWAVIVAAFSPTPDPGPRGTP